MHLLRNGNSLPRIGFGIYQDGTNNETHATTLEALKVGYRLLDTAELYNNEREVGAAVRDWVAAGGNRDEVYYTTKIWDSGQGKHAKRNIEERYKLSGLNHIDLLLIHSPYPGKEKRKETWQAMEEAVDRGIVKNIGVCSYGKRHIEELETYSRHPCVVNQMELHPFLARQDLVPFCQQQGIVVEAFCPLTQARRLNDPRIQTVCAQHPGKDAAQVVLRWAVQRGIVPLPKSVTPARIKSNLQVFDFELTEDQMQLLTTDERYVCDWDPTNAQCR